MKFLLGDQASEAMPEVLVIIFEESWSTETNVLPLTVFSNDERAEEVIAEPSEVNCKVSNIQYQSIKNKSYQTHLMCVCERDYG